MTGPDDDPHRAAFFEAAAALIDRRGITASTMMGLPCLRLHGSFFAAYDHRTGDLLVKLARDEVDRMVEAGDGHPFAPAGRRFREWVAVPPGAAAGWPALVAAAHARVASRLGEVADGGPGRPV